MTDLRIAIIRTQHYHANFWTKAVQQSALAAHAGIWEPDPDLAQRFVREHGVTLHASLSDALSACDAVAICSATSEHLPLIESAVAAGKPVLCEKPLGTDRADGLAIKAILDRNDAVFMQSFPKRFDPATRAIREHVQAGTLGRITQVRVRHGHNHGASPEFRSAWFVDPELSGGGTLLDEGVHAADFLRHVFGDPARVQARTSSAALGLPVEDTAMAIFEWENGLLAEVATSWCYAAADSSIEVYGTEGTLLVSAVDIASRPMREDGYLRLFLSEKSIPGRWEDLGVIPHFKTGVFHEHVMWAFIDALANRRRPPVGAEDGLRALAMIDAAYLSARTDMVQPIRYEEKC